MTQPADSTQKLRVLIADDVQETRRNTRLMLSMNPQVVVVAIASNGRQAVEQAIEHHPDIVLLDINMPEMTGLEAYLEISKVYPETGCIIITAERQLETLDAAMTIGVQEYLVKPFTVDELNDAVNRVSANIHTNRARLAQADQLHKKSENYLEKLAEEYTRTKRADDQAMDVFEQLAANPACDIRWLRTLAVIYLARDEWGKLKELSARLETMKTSKK